MNTPTIAYHAYRLQTDLHAEFDGNRQRIAAELAVATVERTADGIAEIEPSALMTTFRTQPADAWSMLANLTPAQLTIQAIDTACYLLEVEGRDISWSSVLDAWTKRLALSLSSIAPALTPDRLAQARAIANQPATVVRCVVTLGDGSVWDDAGRLLIGPYSPPPIEDIDHAGG